MDANIGPIPGAARLIVMLAPQCRDEAEKCRQLAAEADERSAATLLMLAADYEAEAERLDREPKP